MSIYDPIVGYTWNLDASHPQVTQYINGRSRTTIQPTRIIVSFQYESDNDPSTFVRLEGSIVMQRTGETTTTRRSIGFSDSNFALGDTLGDLPEAYRRYLRSAQEHYQGGPTS
jgi:hypothetical protein